ncbi:DUF2207 family protein [Streptomyces sp. NBC_00557]|uniref:DUF2207 family protein n=1 Tax=Streptomyces sp. NBC_00557 TaxID=2975776 RepID=UPI002E8221F7|nr:hypothetical protein [Streptomyces sp. NBC_00557]WUC40039.1 DUF2207 domain-containing protein [Streptomyces sp. NBC_00557]
MRRRTRDTGSPDPVTGEVLGCLFGGRDEITPSRYDTTFQAGWSLLARRLEDWQAASGLWDAASVRRARAGRYAGIAGAVLGFVIAVVGAGLGGSRHAAGGPVLVAGAVLFGTGLAMARQAWELHRRTPDGSAQWLRVEAFRRYPADPSAHPGTEPLDDDQVRLCTAWAVALGLDDTWRHAVETTAVPTRRPSSHAVRPGPAPAAGLVASAALASTTASSGGGSSGGGSPRLSAAGRAAEALLVTAVRGAVPGPCLAEPRPRPAAPA